MGDEENKGDDGVSSIIQETIMASEENLGGELETGCERTLNIHDTAVNVRTHVLSYLSLAKERAKRSKRGEQEREQGKAGGNSNRQKDGGFALPPYLEAAKLLMRKRMKGRERKRARQRERDHGERPINESCENTETNTERERARNEK